MLLLSERPGIADRICGGCGAVTDAPRPHPETGIRGRKCPVCERWQGEWWLGEARPGETSNEPDRDVAA
jgi:hypothetical protein